MRLSAHALLLPKKGNAAAECEDAVGANAARLRYAVADGATEGFDSRRWARALTKLWCSAPELPQTADGLLAATGALGERLRRRWQGRALPWFVAERAQEPAYAAFAGVEMDRDAEARCWRWNAVAIGDACVFVVRNRDIAEAFPVSTPEGYTSHPLLLPSRPTPSEAPLLAAAGVERSGMLERGDSLWLLTDAVGLWFMTQASGTPRVDELAALLASNDASACAAYFDAERDARRLRNDDVAVVRIEAQD
jgi:hypothetical protein